MPARRRSLCIGIKALMMTRNVMPRASDKSKACAKLLEIVYIRAIWALLSQLLLEGRLEEALCTQSKIQGSRYRVW